MLNPDAAAFDSLASKLDIARARPELSKSSGRGLASRVDPACARWAFGSRYARGFLCALTRTDPAKSRALAHVFCAERAGGAVWSGLKVASGGTLCPNGSAVGVWRRHNWVQAFAAA